MATEFLCTFNWEAMSSVAEVIAAAGAIALLLTTYISLKDAGLALEQSERLATQTEALAQATKDAQALAVKPVIELRQDDAREQIRVTNVGNGPLLEPKVASANGGVRLRGRDKHGTYAEVGALKVGEEAFVFLDDVSAAVDHHGGALVIDGFTTGGQRTRWSVPRQAVGASPAVVAESDDG